MVLRGSAGKNTQSVGVLTQDSAYRGKCCAASGSIESRVACFIKWRVTYVSTVSIVSGRIDVTRTSYVPEPRVCCAFLAELD